MADQSGRPEPTEREKGHVRELFKLVDAALSDNESRFKKFNTWRRAYRGYLDDGSQEQVRSNLIYANIASMLPRVYAKNPDISFAPAESVAPERYDLIKQFAETGEKVVHQQFRDGKLKPAAKNLVRSAMVCSLGWWKVTFQEDRQTDPVILGRINDVQDNLDRIRTLSENLQEGEKLGDDELALQAELEAQLQALQSAPQVVSGRGTVIDSLLAEDVLVLDGTVRNFTDYTRAARIAHRMWLSEQTFQDTFGYKPTTATRYAVIGEDQSGKTAEQGYGYYQVFEVWDKTSGTVFTICKGEQGYCRAPFVPQKVGRRWYPFFALGFNQVDGQFYPLSDVELLEQLVVEYNETRDQLHEHRDANVPVRVFKKGGNFTDEDAQRIQNRKAGDLIGVNGVPGKPIGEDIEQLDGIPLNPAVYDTTPIRSDMEQIMGGGDAARGTVMKPKTATEAEIMAIGMGERTDERRDAVEDLIGEAAQYVFEICLNELTEPEVKRIAGEGAQWPKLTIDESLSLVSIEIKAGSTGKPNQAQEQDRWLQLLPIFKEAMVSVMEMRANGQFDMADAISELMRETLRRFDERIDMDKFIPPMQGAAELEQMTPEQLRAALMQAMGVIQQLQQANAEMTDEEGRADRQVERTIEQKRAEAEIKADPNLQPPPKQPMPKQPMPMMGGGMPMMPDPMQAIAPVIEQLNAKIDSVVQLVQQLAPQPQEAAPDANAAVLAAIQQLAESMNKPKTRKVSIVGPSGQVYAGESMEQ